MTIVLAIPGWADRLIWAGVAILIAIVVHQALRRLVRRWSSEPAEHTADLRRLRRRETAAAFVLVAIRYLIGIAVDVNRASADELASLPGIGPAIAARVIAGRPYASVDELERVKGIGPKTLAKLRSRARVD